MDKIDITQILINDGRELNLFIVEELKKSIENNGLLHPITVNNVNGIYSLVSGNHRLTALKELGYKEVNCVIYDNLSSTQCRLIELSENLTRQELSALDKSLGFAEIKKLEESLGIVNKHGGDRKSKDREDKPSYSEKVAQQLKISERQVLKYVRVGNELLEDKETINKLNELRCNDDLEALTKFIGSKKQPSTPEERKEILEVVEKKVTEYKKKPSKALREGTVKVKSLNRIVNQYEVKEWQGTIELNTVNLYSATELINKLPEKSINMIFTDPPYFEESIYLYEEIAKLAEKVLTDNGLCVVYTPVYYLGRVIIDMSKYLDYFWQVIVSQEWHNTDTATKQYGMIHKHRPVLIFSRKGIKPKPIGEPSTDLKKPSKPSKEWHPWQQDIETPKSLMKTFLSKGNIVLDCCVGGGTTLAVAKELGFNYLGFDIDKEAVNSTLNRLDTI